MLNSKFDINSPEWIERVFENRNKSYGAYDLRKHYALNLFKAFAITIVSIAVIVLVTSLLMDKVPASVNIKKGAVSVTDKQLKIKLDDAKPEIDKKSKILAPATVHGHNNIVEQVLDSRAVEIKPMPVGGVEAWVKFLENNLRYPPEAKQQRITGSVLMSFIVERDGHISNILVSRPAGHGFDQEALRVLKLSPIWAAGMQGGQTVRVKYILPINFNIEHR
ncbi:TonB family protein [Mucilaginibacter gracilis]|uniref:TonB family protein n=1 Tax=Mucilaginibacter gracilis TaxID=423350 RepID=A0A495J224_9SPHI|nr:energy transducer TonB [Mucilaginibacter gracilis]RKR82354.1 TonB family protein [Mucilaginibacter gracilis]